MAWARDGHDHLGDERGRLSLDELMFQGGDAWPATGPVHGQRIVEVDRADAEDHAAYMRQWRRRNRLQEATHGK